MIKILVVSGIYPSLYKPYEGTFIHRRAKQLAKEGFDVEIFTTKVLTFATYLRFYRDVVDYYRTPKQFQYKWEGLQVNGLCAHLIFPGHLRSRTQPWLIQRAITPLLDKLFSIKRYDIILLTHGGPLAQAVSNYSIKRKISYISSANGGYVDSCFDKPDSFTYKRERDIFLNSKMTICVSNDMKCKVKQITDRQTNIITFYSGVDIGKVKPELELRRKVRMSLSITSNEIVILFIGHVMREKGIYELLNVFNRLLEKRYNLRLLIVGAVMEQIKIDRAISILGIKSRVIFTDGVANKDIPGYLNASDIFAFPSWMEGMPNALMEACSAGLPSVSTDVGGIPELIIDGKTGFIIPPCNEDALYTKLEDLICSKQKRTELGQAARARMIKDFNYKKNGKKLAVQITNIIKDSIAT